VTVAITSSIRPYVPMMSLDPCAADQKRAASGEEHYSVFCRPRSIDDPSMRMSLVRVPSVAAGGNELALHDLIIRDCNVA
jgi:hypothetical protein